MEYQEILNQTLQALSPLLKCEGDWTPHADHRLDAQVTLNFPDGQLNFATEVKMDIRESTMKRIQNQKRSYPDFLLVAYRIHPRYRQLLQDMDVNYLETNGNAFIQKDGIFVLIDKFPPLKEDRGDTNRAFTKTGLRVFFQLLIDNENLEASQRDLADQAGVALGNIPLVLRGLKTAGLLVSKNRHGYHWANKDEAIDQWINGYRNILKPALYQGKYRLPEEKPWYDLPLPSPKTRWGGEPGGDILTNHLRPEKLILFTDLGKTDFIKQTRLMPDAAGQLEVYETFWDRGNGKGQSAPPLLVYADLVINGDKRSLETAQIIYDKHLTEL